MDFKKLKYAANSRLISARKHVQLAKAPLGISDRSDASLRNGGEKRTIYCIPCSAQSLLAYFPARRIVCQKCILNGRIQFDRSEDWIQIPCLRFACHCAPSNLSVSIEKMVPEFQVFFDYIDQQFYSPLVVIA